ncbi:hypothetical protein, conserved [Babesia bigemina]|uniref:Uncharacterized protein n=1 Tax=Babesia bigemina TaxID=5866 RepID=A0A061D7Y1_BABBI|nr:hypothetical protein, conserved [Babesia bigemina]CDR93800.1 hypothetical protein, conserved [Babesia bigemina]|eukprot:XP_012765986.1 hypothetical protein, conserved [Babesia bigemina]
MGRDVGYSNLDRGGFASLTTQPSANDNMYGFTGPNDYLRNESAKNVDGKADIRGGDYRPGIGLTYGSTLNYVSGGETVKNGSAAFDPYRKASIWEDCATFSREASSDVLGRNELQKFEHNPYRSRYLNTPECEGLVTKHCQRLLHSYYGRADALSTSAVSGASKSLTFDDVCESALTSSDHLTSIATLSILARYHRIGYLLPQVGDPGSCAANIYAHVLNVLRVIYAASAGGVEAGGRNNVDTARRFFSLLGRGIWQTASDASDAFASLDRRLAQRISLLYVLCLHLLDVLLSSDCDCVEELLAADGDVYDTLGCVGCCFVEQAVRHGDRTGLSGNDLPEDRMVPNLGDRGAIFSKHWSVLNGLLSRGVKFSNSELLVKGVKALCNVLESSNTGRSLLLWAYCVYVRLCPAELSQNNHSIPRILFEYMTKCRSVLQLQAITGALSLCMRDPGFVRYADERMNPQKTFAIFVLHSCNLIHNKMDDLAVPILQMLHQLFDVCPKTLPDVANTMSGTTSLIERYSDTVGNAVETFLNVATLSLGPIQVIMALIMRRILLRCDVTKSLSADLRSKFVKHLIAVVGFRKTAGAAVGDAVGLVSKVALLDAFVQSGGLPELMSAMKDVNAKQLRLLALHSSSVSCDSLHKMLCVGDIATKLVAYDALAGYRADGMDAGTLVLCALCSVVKMCPDVSCLLREYASTYAGMSEYHGTGSLASEGKFLRALSGDANMADPTRSMRVAGLLCVHSIVASVYMSSESCKQTLIHALLCPEGSTRQQHQELVEKYKAQLASHRREVQRSHARLDAQARELQQQKDSATKQLEQLREEYAGKVERSRAELATAQSQLSAASSQSQQLDRECVRLRAQVSDLDQALRKISSEHAQANEQLREATTHRERLKNEVSGLQGQLEQRDRTIEQLRAVEADNGRLNEEVGELNAQVERVYRMLISLMSKHRQVEVDLARSKEDAAQNSRQLHERQLQVEELSNRCRSHENTINALRAAKEGTEGEVHRLGRELHALEGRLGKSTEELSALQGRYAQTSQALQSCEEQNRRLAEQLDRCELQLRQRGEQLSTIYSTFQDKKPY